MDSLIDGAVATLAQLGGKYPQGVAPRIEPPASVAEISEFQVACGKPVPATVLALLRRTRAIVAMDIRNGYWIGGPVELARSVRRHDYPTGFEADGQPAQVIPVATDGGGNAFMIWLDVGSVWRWDHETGAVACVSQDLPAFLRRVAEDWAHDLEGDTAWTYLV